MSNVVSPRQVAASLDELWSPRIVGEVDDAYIKVAKIHGSLAWHAHENEDELFLILKGRLRIEMETGTVELGEGEMFVVPKGVRHNPMAEQECHITQLSRTPPSITSSVPVILLDSSSDSRNRAARATSSEVPIRLKSDLATSISMNAFSCSGGSPTFFRMGVSIGPGLSTLTRMPRGANSTARVLPNEMTAALVAE